MDTDDTPTGADYRETAELDDSSDDPADWTVLPPTLTIRGEPAPAIREAVEHALKEHPNSISAPVLSSTDEHSRDGPAVAYLDARYEELPISTGPGIEDVGWLPPYRAREEIDAAISDALPEGLMIEAMNNSTTGFYEA